MGIFLEFFKEFCVNLGYIAIIIFSAFAIYGIELICKKLGINIDNEKHTQIINIIKYVINIIDERYVDIIKKNSLDGKLTDYQKELVHNKSIELVKELLTSEQIQYLIDKYKVEDIDELILQLIDANIKEARKNTDLLPIIREDDGEESSCAEELNESDLESLSVCGGDCNNCNFECTYRRL